MQYLGPRAAAYALAGLFAASLACDLLWMPVQVGDSLGEILDAQQSASVVESFVDSADTDTYLRPLRIAQIKALFDAARGSHYWLVYRGFHAILIVLALLLFVRALRVTTVMDFGAAAVALVVLIGLHTFRGNVAEAFPINHFLEIAVLCLLALNMAQSRGGPWIDAAAVLTFVVAALTLESGLLVWVVALGAWLVGWRGISTRGVAAISLMLLAYMYVRFAYLSTGVPTITERSSGYLLEILEPSELQARFGASPLEFYVYNVLASFGSVLFSEPQAGVFIGVRDWMEERPLVRVALPMVTSLATTLLIGWALIRSLRPWRPLPETARYILVFGFVLAANAALSYVYTKDEIMSTAGMFYALAAYAAVRAGLTAASARPAAAIAFSVVMCVLSSAWAVRALNVHFVLRSQAVKHQIDWVDLPAQWRRNDRWPEDPAAESVIMRLYDDAIGMELPNTRVGLPEWPERIWRE